LRGFEDEARNLTAPNPIKVHTTYATFEVAHWPALEVQKQERLTEERITKLCPPPEARSNHPRIEKRHRDDEMLVVHPRDWKVHTSVAKRRRHGEKEPALGGGSLDKVVFHPENSTRAFQERSFLRRPSVSTTAGAAAKLGGQANKENVAEEVAQAPTVLRRAAQKTKQKQKIDKLAVAQKLGSDPSKVVHVEKKSSLLNGDGQNLESRKRLTTVQQPDQALVTQTQDPRSQMSVMGRAAALQANRDKHTLPLNPPKPRASSHLALPMQTTQSSQKPIPVSLNFFFKTTTEACSGVFYEIHRNEICSELQAQRAYVEEILLTRKESCGLSEDARKAKVNSVLTHLLEAFEKTWADSHPEVTVPVIANVIDRQIAYLALDVATKSGDVTDMDEPNLLIHITAVQWEAMSRQRIILKAITQSLKQEAQSNRHVAAPFGEQETKLLPSVSPSLKQLPSRMDGSFEPEVQNTILVIDEVTGVASVMQHGDLGKAIREKPTRDPQKKTLKRKQQAETSPSHERPRTSNSQKDIDAVALPEQSMSFQSLSPSATTRAGTCIPASDTENFRDGADTEVGSNGTVVPAELVRTASVWSSTDPSLNAIANTNAPIQHINISSSNERGYMNVVESFKTHGCHLVSEEQRAEDLLRHRQANRVLLGEHGPLLDAGIDTGVIGGFCYVTTVEFDGFGFEDQLELPDYAAPGLDLDSGGLWK
jgi:hypothetical protein